MFEMDIKALPGVGPRKAELFAKLGLIQAEQLLTHYPSRYQNRDEVKPIYDLIPGIESACVGRVMGRGRLVPKGKGRTAVVVEVFDGTATLQLWWWNQMYRQKMYWPGAYLYVKGTMLKQGAVLTMSMPDTEIINEDEFHQPAGIAPIYPSTAKLTQSSIRQAITAALTLLLPGLEDPLPPHLLEQHNLMPLRQAVQEMHNPSCMQLQQAARHRIAFDELLQIQLQLAERRREAAQGDGVTIATTDHTIRAFVGNLPFPLTGAQRKAMLAIRGDLSDGRAMNRLLHGDVGSGKTTVAAFALWAANAAGYQSALLAPTEILAEQHYRTLTKTLGPMGLQVELLAGTQKAAERRAALANLANGRTHVVVGTHAIFQDSISFYKLGVCVIDEQHRFGVEQRKALAAKGAGGLVPNLLAMSATPIPQTLALTVYGDLDVSILDEMPPGRQPITTALILPEDRANAYAKVRQEVERGRQAYVICPLVSAKKSASTEEETVLSPGANLFTPAAKAAELKAASTLALELQEDLLAGLSVGLVHGQLSKDEREFVMAQFREGNIDVLVATTVIEVGVDVPNATVMVIEDADRFGLSQLHQLRGRVGRGQHASYCLLVAALSTADSQARLGVMCQTQNGFKIAEADLQLRGAGELAGIRQSGATGLRVANLATDLAIIQQARAVAMSQH